MSSTYDLALSARKVMPRLAVHTDVNAEARRDLAEAGVSKSRIEALYPFALEDHLGAMEAVVRDESQWLLIELAGILDNLTVQETIRELPVGLRNAIKRQQMESSFYSRKEELGWMEEVKIGPASVFTAWSSLLLYFWVLARLAEPGEVLASDPGSQATNARRLLMMANRLDYLLEHSMPATAKSVSA